MMPARLSALLLSAILLALSPAVPVHAALAPDEVLDDPVLEQRARGLASELRCLVCQNQSIDDSDAPLARDLRLLVRERLAAGDGDEEVIDFVVARYGEYVLLRPRWGTHTLVLWLAAPVLLLLAVGLAATAFRRPRLRTAPAPLTPAERRALDEISGRDA